MSERGIDCSGLVHMAHRRLGRIVPRDADQQEDSRLPRSRQATRGQGDLVTYGSEEADGATHIAFWLGDGRILHATERPARRHGRGRARGLPRSPPPVRPPVSRLAWAWVDPDSGEEAHEDGERVVPAASTIKLFIASAFWRSARIPASSSRMFRPPAARACAEYLSAESRLTLGDLALLMLAVSDNGATNVVLDRLGFDAVNAEIGRLGLERTVVRRPMMTSGPENETCALDLARGRARMLDEARIAAALELALDSQLRYHLPACAGRREDRSSECVQRSGPARRRGAAARDPVCSSPPARPDEVSAGGAGLWHRLNNRGS